MTTKQLLVAVKQLTALLERAVPGLVAADDRQPTDTATAPKRRSPSPRQPVEEATPCSGCSDLSCVKSWKGMQHLPQTDDAWVEWATAHGVVKRGTCELHPTAEVNESRYASGTCMHRNPTDSNRCRRSVLLKHPLLGANAKYDLSTLFLFWAHVVNGEPICAICRNLGINKNTATSLIRRLGSTMERWNRLNEWKFAHASVDETFIGKRLQNVGNKARRKGVWFLTLTERDKTTGKSGRTVWYAVKRRTKAILLPLIKRHIQSAKSLVFSDCFKSYIGLDEICRHATVNHKLEFVNRDGPTIVHTNNAEGCHGNIKRLVRRTQHRYGCSSREVIRSIALQTSLWNVGGFGDKMRVLFMAAKLHYQATDDDDIETVSSVTEDELEASDITPPKNPVAIHRTKDGSNKKRPREEEPAKNSNKNVCLPGDAVLRAIQRKTPKGWAVVDPHQWSTNNSTPTPIPAHTKGLLVPLCVAQKWVIGVSTPGDKTILFYDAWKPYATSKRKQALLSVAKRIGAFEKRKKVCVLKACEQLSVEGCGKFVIEKAWEAMGVRGTLTEREMKSLLK